jgi:molybdopterin-guanine dinucleotide biosynthesis protein A
MPEQRVDPPLLGPIGGVVLAGGAARRMGGGKAMVRLGGRPLLAHVIDRLRPQLDSLVIGCHRRDRQWPDFGLPIVEDPTAERPGPLGGVLAAMNWMRAHRPDIDWLTSAPLDTPFLPPDLVRRLLAAANDAMDIACATSASRRHPVCALWPVRLADALREGVESGEARAVGRWMATYRVVEVDWAVDSIDPFFNINAPADLEQARRFTL